MLGGMMKVKAINEDEIIVFLNKKYFYDLDLENDEKVEEYLSSTFYWFEQFDMADLRAYASIYFKQYPNDEIKKYLREWSNDQRYVTLYVNGSVNEYCVADLAKDAID